ncbi:hypothetical protein ACLMJK_008858 [Lecanora helva]
MQYKPLLIALGSLALTARADFHILDTICAYTCGTYEIFDSDPQSCAEYTVVFVASNQYNCKGKSDAPNIPETAGHLQDFMHLDQGLCGSGALNFYKRDNDTYEFYADGGDGSVLGTCYKGDGSTEACGSGLGICDFKEQYVCYTYLCN